VPPREQTAVSFLLRITENTMTPLKSRTTPASFLGLLAALILLGARAACAADFNVTTPGGQFAFRING
jgi:hypothetical protein